MRTTSATHNPIVGLFIHACNRGGKAAWLSLLTTHRQATIQKHHWLGCKVTDSTTTNTLALLAVLNALRALKAPATVIVHTDNKYLKRAITEWLPTWRTNGWKNAKGDPIADASIWQGIAEWVAQEGNDLTFRFYTGNKVHPTITFMRKTVDERLAS